LQKDHERAHKSPNRPAIPNPKSKIRNRMKRLLILLPLAFLAIFFFYPLASITARGLAQMV